jgi:hypothetical protein
VRRTFGVSVLITLIVAAAVVAGQQPPPPQPFPRSGGSGPAPPPAAPAPAGPARGAQGPPPSSSRPGAPTEATLGIPGVIFPQSEYLEAFDLGRGQRCYLFGTNSAFLEVVAYYKQTLKDGGRELFKAPAMQQFETARFQDQTMTTQPGVVVKDYSFGDGYLKVDGLKEHRFRTVIQIVPGPGR